MLSIAQSYQLDIYMVPAITRAKKPWWQVGATVCHEIIVVEGNLSIANKFVHNEPASIVDVSSSLNLTMQLV